MSVTTEKPVVTAAQITAAVGLIWPAFLIVCQAFDWWDPTQEQMAAITGLWGALTAAVGLITGKVAASRVFVASSAERMAEASHEKAHAEDAKRVAEAEERVRVAESFGTPHQDQSTHPAWGPVGGRGDMPPDAITPEHPGGSRAGHPTDPMNRPLA